MLRDEDGRFSFLTLYNVRSVTIPENEFKKILPQSRANNRFIVGSGYIALEYDYVDTRGRWEKENHGRDVIGAPK